MSSSINQYVIRLKVSMNEVLFVDALHSEYHLCHVKTGRVLFEDILLYEKLHEVSARQVLHHQVEIVVVCEGRLELDDPLGIRLSQYVDLRPDVN